jgi:hypothetical protein
MLPNSRQSGPQGKPRASPCVGHVSSGTAALDLRCQRGSISSPCRFGTDSFSGLGNNAHPMQPQSTARTWWGTSRLHVATSLLAVPIRSCRTTATHRPHCMTILQARGEILLDVHPPYSVAAQAHPASPPLLPPSVWQLTEARGTSAGPTRPSVQTSFAPKCHVSASQPAFRRMPPPTRGPAAGYQGPRGGAMLHP